LHPSDNHTKITRRVNLVSGNRELSSLLLEVITEPVVDLEDLTLGVTLGLDW